MVPVGAGPPERSITVAVHVVDWVVVTDPGAHVTLTAVGRTTLRTVDVVASSLMKSALSTCGVVATFGA
jgi:hypothetical protein